MRTPNSQVMGGRGVEGEKKLMSTGTGNRTPVPWLRTTCPDP